VGQSYPCSNRSSSASSDRGPGGAGGHPHLLRTKAAQLLVTSPRVSHLPGPTGQPANACAWDQDHGQVIPPYRPAVEWGRGQASRVLADPAGSGPEMRQRVTSKPRAPSLPTGWRICLLIPARRLLQLLLIGGYADAGDYVRSPCRGRANPTHRRTPTAPMPSYGLPGSEPTPGPRPSAFCANSAAAPGTLDISP
jgi:hypothetical protein